jgi:DNA-directed RNA polymerase specialized sigma24 family protein
MIQLIEKLLPPREAKAVILRYGYDRNTNDAAKEMCVGERTFSGYLCEGLKKIRRFARAKKTETK